MAWRRAFRPAPESSGDAKRAGWTRAGAFGSRPSASGRDGGETSAAWARPGRGRREIRPLYVAAASVFAIAARFQRMPAARRARRRDAQDIYRREMKGTRRRRASRHRARLGSDWEATGRRLGDDWEATGRRPGDDRRTTGGRPEDDQEATGGRPGSDEDRAPSHPPPVPRRSAAQRHASTTTRFSTCSLRWKKCSAPGITTTGSSCGRAQS